MEKRELKQLLEKRRQGTLSADEEVMLESWYNYFAANSKNEVNDDVLHDNLELIGKRLPLKHQPTVIKTLWPRLVAAMVILGFLGIGYLLLHKDQSNSIKTIVKNEVAPGKNQATLTLASGKKIVLTKNMTGMLSVQGNMNIQMASGGRITYSPSNDRHQVTTEIAYNTLITKKGEQFPLVLADGTQVMLDAESSITYPVSFSGKERVVTITGQAYLKVVHNARQPFLVLVKGQTIKDIGTEFNINAYDEEGDVKTTLLAGSVKVYKANKSVILSPGEQSQVDNNSDHIVVVKDADTETAVAWKNGFFEYHNANIETVMRQLARWYDVDIQYEGNIPQRKFSGKIQRRLNASQVLDLLSFTKIHFRTEGKKIIVTP